jgi:hypothetical protein
MAVKKARQANIGLLRHPVKMFRLKAVMVRFHCLPQTWRAAYIGVQPVLKTGAVVKTQGSIPILGATLGSIQIGEGDGL